MFSKKLENIFTINKLKENITSFDVDLHKLQKEILKGNYIPQPLKRIYIKKNAKKRPIAIANNVDKIVQKTLYLALNEYFDKTFSNHSYGYRPNKSTLKAIKRVKDYIKRKYVTIYKSDFKDFFETINHDKLINLLDIYIEDKRVINLIAQFIESGVLEKNYYDHIEGIHQGDILSPLLSNIYLNQVDMFLERENIEFVRFADDFILFFKEKNPNKKVEKLKKFIQNLDISLNEEKSYYSNIQKGFSFLGCYFHNDKISIDKDRFDKQIKSLEELKSLKFDKFLEKIKQKYEGLNRYYFKLITNTHQLNILKSQIKSIFIDVLVECFKSTTKKDVLSKLNNYNLLDINVDEIIDIAYNKYKSQKILIPKEKIIKQKKKVIKNLIKSSIIVITEYGVFLGISKNKIVLKQKGKITKSFPKSQIKRIIINSKGVSLSSDFVHMCSKNSISIEFIDYKSTPYATIVEYNMSYPKTALKQLEILNTSKRLEYAKEFIRAKIINQKNYLKYHNKYYKNLENEITKIKQLLKKSQKSKTIEELMGYEGSVGAIYWSAIGKILKDDEFKRITKGATDTKNSAFNYGYAILYNKVQVALIRAGLSINISFLHSLSNKPSLVFDMVEQFRTFVVDRAIVFSLNKSDDIKINDSKLTKEAKKRIVEEVNKRLSSLQEYKGTKRSLEDIISLQAYHLVKSINENIKYKSFVARF